MLHVVGHFGTLYSYATVAGRVAEALKEAGLLTDCSNLDETWHPRWQHLLFHSPSGPAKFVLVVAAPNHYIGDYADLFGRERSAIFASPNTDMLDDEHVKTLGKFGLIITPSRFCAETVSMYVADSAPAVLPLGASVPAGTGRIPRPAGAPVRVLHFTSDQAWPSRKGTEALIKAWGGLNPRNAQLKIHGPPALHKNALYAIVDSGADETISYEVSPKLGTSDQELNDLYWDADLIVSPSRSEGFGMMILGAIVAGVPLLTTYNTGHADFLRLRPGAWLPIPTAEVGPLEYEYGNAAMLDYETFAEALDLALTPFARERMRANYYTSFGAAAKEADWGSWKWATQKWIARIKLWIEEEKA